MNSLQIERDRREWRGMMLEAVQLRMVVIAARFPTQDCLRQESLAPLRNQTLRIKILRM
jgi:hypothetical protein